VAVVGGEADLLEVVLALQAGGGLADLLHRRQEQADEDGDDGYHHQQLDQREAAAGGSGEGPGHGRTPSERGDEEKQNVGAKSPETPHPWAPTNGKEADEKSSSSRSLNGSTSPPG